MTSRVQGMERNGQEWRKKRGFLDGSQVHVKIFMEHVREWAETMKREEYKT
jgi:hypothetical protein